MTYGGSLMSNYFTDSILSGEITRKVSKRMKSEKSKDYCKAHHNNVYCFFYNGLTDVTSVNLKKAIQVKVAVSRQSSSFCLILAITRPQSLWNLK